MGQYDDEERELMARIAGEWVPPVSDPSSPRFPLWAEKMVGTTLGEGQRYTLERVLGVGGMGVVFRGASEQGPVAIKILSPANDHQSEQRRKRFFREVEAMARIESPYVVKVLDWGREPCEYLVMEYLEGEDLGARLARTRRIEWLAARELAIRICKGLAAAHAKGVAHRDLKPSNCFLCADGSLKLLDFGLAVIKGQDKLTQSHEAIGTATYMAPERFHGGKVAEAWETAVPRAQVGDLYALGVILYEMVTGALPFQASTLFGLMDSVLHQPPRAPSALGVALPPSAETLVLKLLEKDPKARFQSAAEVLDTLEGVAMPVARAPRSRWGVGMSAAAVALTVGAALWWRPPVGAEFVLSARALAPNVGVPRAAIPTLGWPIADLAVHAPGSAEPSDVPIAKPSRPRAPRPVAVAVAEPLPEEAAAPQEAEPSPAPPTPPPEVGGRDIPILPPLSLQALLDTKIPARCRRDGKGLRVDLVIEVAASGMVVDARAEPPHASSPAGVCLRKGLRGKHFGSNFEGSHRHVVVL